MCKEMPVIPVNKAVDPKRIIRKNGGPGRRRGTRGCKKVAKLPHWLNFMLPSNKLGCFKCDQKYCCEALAAWRSGHHIRLRNMKTQVRIPAGYNVLRET
jgi:hypothetical protein